MLAVLNEAPEQLLREILKGVVPAVWPIAERLVEETVGNVTVVSLLSPFTEIVQVVSVIFPLMVIMPSAALVAVINADEIISANNEVVLVNLSIITPFLVFDKLKSMP